MKNINILQSIGLVLFLCLGISVSAQEVSATEHSIAFKTIRVVDDIPVVYQNEVKGGHHSYDVDPWDTIPLSKIQLGMLSTNTKYGITYRYKLDAFTDGVALFNREVDWERIMIVTLHIPSKKYTPDEIVLSDTLLYKASDTIPGTVNAPIAITDPRWKPLNADQKITSFSMDVDTLELNLENGGIKRVDMSQFNSEFRVSDNTGIVSSHTSGGVDIVLINGAYTLPTAVSKKGATVTIKNVKAATPTITAQVAVSTNGTELLDGVDATIQLFRQYDYITVMSDGTQWFLVAEGSSKIAQRNTAAEEDHLDAFYLGSPDATGSWRIVYNDSGDQLLIQRRQADTTWKTKTSIVP